MEVVAPSSAPMFVMVALSGTDRALIPSPPHSIMAPTPPFTDRIPRISKLISFAVTKGFRLPVRFTLYIFGIVIWYAPPAMATATSSPPAPMASIPIPPPVGVWLSEPIKVFPGIPNLSK